MESSFDHDIEKWWKGCERFKESIDNIYRAKRGGSKAPQLFKDMRKVYILEKLFRNGNEDIFDRLEGNIKQHQESMDTRFGGMSSGFGGMTSGFGGMSSNRFQHMRRREKIISDDDPLEIDSKFKDEFNSKIKAVYGSIKTKSFVGKFSKK
jgi:hypothetical protein